MSDETKPTPTEIPVTVTIAGTKASGFTFANGKLQQYRLDFKETLPPDKAKRLAEFVVKLVNE